MFSSVGLEVMNSTTELNWKTVKKGRRSKKAMARGLNGDAKVGNSTSPKRVGDFSGSDSDKFGEVDRGQSASGKSESVLIKKGRHLLHSPSPHSWTPSLRHRDSASPLSEDHESAKVGFGNGFDNFFRGAQTKLEYDAGDFSGIELLAAAASLDVDDDNANKEKHNLVVEDSLLMPKNSDASGSATQTKVGLESNESDNALSKMTVHGDKSESSPVLGNSAPASQSLCLSPKNVTIPKVNRQHWDLNTLMDAWDEPSDDPIAGNTSKDVHGDMHMEERHKACTDHVLPSPDGLKDEFSNMKTEEDKLTLVSPDRICSERPRLEEHLVEPPKYAYTNAAGETSYQAVKRDVSERNATQVSNRDARMCTYNHVMITDSILNSAPGTVAKIPVEECSRSVREFERTTAYDSFQAGTPEVTANDMRTNEISESPVEFQCEDNRDSLMISELPGTLFQNGQPVLTADSEIRNDGTFISGSSITDLLGYLEAPELVAKHEDYEDSKMIVTEDSSKSCSAGVRGDEPTASVGKIGSDNLGPPISDASQSNLVHVVKGDDQTLFQEGYDSPYEDGELRGSVLYSWEDMELENECVDYESDGRNGDGSDAADYHGSEIVEGGSEGSHATGKSNMLVKRFPEGKSKGEAVKHSLRNPVKDDSYNYEIAGKGSNAGSGTTVEHPMEMLMGENDDGMKRSQLMFRRDAFDVKATRIDEYASRTARGKLQSRVEGRSSFEATDGKDVYFIQQCRSRPLGSYSRPERDSSPGKYPGRYNRPAAHYERDGVHQWTSWGSRNRYTSNYTRPRSKNGDSPDKIGGLDFHDPRQNTSNYLSKGLHRPLRRRSPVERDDYFGRSRRMPITRGVSNYRNRGHYSQRGGRDFAEDFEQTVPDGAGPPVSMSRYLSGRDRSFSPSCGRNSHITLPPRRRSRSRSRTRSPARAWHPHRGRILGNRRNSRSPNFRCERMRMPFPKPNFASEHGDGYISPSRGRFSPQRNCRWVDDRSNFADNNHVRRRRSPVRGNFRPTRQRFDQFGSSGHRLKSDEYFRPATRPGRFSFVSNSGRDCKLESNYDDSNWRHGEGGDIMQRGLHADSGNIRRFRHNAVGGGDFETSNLNDEDDVRVSDTKDVVPQHKGDGEDNTASNKI